MPVFLSIYKRQTAIPVLGQLRRICVHPWPPSTFFALFGAASVPLFRRWFQDRSKGRQRERQRAAHPAAAEGRKFG